MTLPSLFQSFIHVSRYARWSDDLRRRETWEETVDRYLDFMCNVQCQGKIDDKTKAELRAAIIGLEVMPSMRCFMTAGPALQRDNAAGFNCTGLIIDSVEAFDEMMYLLMCGCGVGFSVERQFIDKLPVVASKLRKSPSVIKVDDSRMGWANALRELLSLLYQGRIPSWDVSEVRPAGARLKTFGGRASGAGPLVDLFRFIITIFQGAEGRKLTSIECHDIACKIGEVVVAGGVRRSAEMSLSNLSDDRMRSAKSGQWWETTPWRAMANNSAAYTDKPGMDVWFKEWQALFDSKSGERGIFNREAAKKHMAKLGRRDPNYDFVINPCGEIVLRPAQMCVAGATPLITQRHGIAPISEFVGKTVQVWNGKAWSSVIPVQTHASRQLVRVTLSDGSYLDCTPDHRWSVKTRFQKNWAIVEAKDLLAYSGYSVQVEDTVVGSTGAGSRLHDAYTLGFAVGDGFIIKGKRRDRVGIDLFGAKDQACPVSGTRQKPYMPAGNTVGKVRAVTACDPDLLTALKSDPMALLELAAHWSQASVRSFIAGLADADGTLTDHGGIRIYVSGEQRVRNLQLLLTWCGVRSSVCLASDAGIRTNKGVRKQGLWYVQITDARALPCSRLDVSRGHTPRFKGKYQTIRSVSMLPGTQATYCFEEYKEHKAVFANVLTHQCNLSEVVVRAEDDVASLKRKLRLAAILGTMQATLTNFHYLRDVWKANADEEALLGVSMTGIMDNRLLSMKEGKTKLNDTLDELREYVVKTNKEWAKKLGVNQATACTTVKPSGTVSQLVDCASGMHPRWSQYYIRTVRGSINDPVTKVMIDQGFPWEPSALKPDVEVVFSFPVKAPDGCITVDSISALEQLELWKCYKEHWCEHQPSITVYVREHEWMEVGAWVYRHFDIIGGLSFLPATGHTYSQAPYQEVSKAEYETLAAKMPKSVDWGMLAKYETDDSHVTATRELACTGEACELVDVVGK